MTWLGARLGLGSLPEGVTWRSLYGLSVLCGIGFTMSLFISSLAFEESSINTLGTDRLGVLAGTLVSAVWGYVALRMVLPPRPEGSTDP